MQAVVKTARGPGAIELREVPAPAPGPDEVGVAVDYAGICGSDIQIRHDNIGLNLRVPVVMGHEFVGHIDSLGDNVRTWEVGDRVVAETAFSSCGACHLCLTGHDNVCAEKHLIGYWHNGAFAPQVVIPARRLHRPPPTRTDLELVLAEPVAGCAHAVFEQARVAPGDRVVVFGSGTVGLITSQLARAAGASVILSGTSAHRLQIARELNLDLVVDRRSEDLTGLVQEVTGGKGCDLFFDCAGAEIAVCVGLDVTRRRGTLVLQGLAGNRMAAPLDQIAYKELRVVGAMGQKWSAWERAMSLLATSEIQLDALISDVVPLADWESAFDRVEARSGLKVAFKPGG